jgi:GNAT superfamily N-acetyltransferase
VQIDLRKPVPADAPFIYAVVEEAMRKHVEATWGRWDPIRVERESREDAVDPNTRIIQFSGRDCGVFCCEHEAGALWVRTIYILKEFQRRGIGKQLLARAQDDARAVGMPVRLRVLKVNPATHYYELLGFEVYDDLDEFFYMQRAS